MPFRVATIFEKQFVGGCTLFFCNSSISKHLLYNPTNLSLFTVLSVPHVCGCAGRWRHRRRDWGPSRGWVWTLSGGFWHHLLLLCYRHPAGHHSRWDSCFYSTSPSKSTTLNLYGWLWDFIFWIRLKTLHCNSLDVCLHRSDNWCFWWAERPARAGQRRHGGTGIFTVW